MTNYTIQTTTNTSGHMSGAQSFVSSCTCNVVWNSILPPPACPMHSGQANQLQPMVATPPVAPPYTPPMMGIPPEYWDYDWWFEEEETTNEEAIQGLMEIVEDLDATA